MRELPDSELARLAADGSRAAFDAIFGRYGQELYRFSVALTGAGSGEELFRAAIGRGIAALRAGLGPGDLRSAIFKGARETADALGPQAFKNVAGQTPVYSVRAAARRAERAIAPVPAAPLIALRPVPAAAAS